jgi:tripartite-type tricarboxylate transporter receptor subunit TctC
MMVRRREVLTFAAAGTVGAAHAQAPAAAWAPTRPVRLVTPYGAGNVADQVARILAEELSQRWSQRVVVDNQPGAGGVIGTSQVVRAAADGTTLGFIAIAALAIVPHLMRQAPYDPLSDVVAIHGVSVSRSAIAVNSELPVRSLVDLATYARARPPGDPLAYYSAGTGTVPHLNLEQLRRELDFPAEHIPYRTSGAGLADLIAGRVQMTMDAASVTLPHIQRGTLRGLAWNGPARNPLIPDVPTLAEAAPGLALMNAWQGIYGPASLPVEVTARIAQDVRAILAQPGFAGRMPGGAEPYLLGPAEMAAQLRDDHARLGRLVADIGLERS